MFDEARLMARVTSPRVVRAIDAGTLEDTPYLVQEYVDGVDLAELDRDRRTALGVGLPLWFVCHVMEEACRALHAAHQVGVIHRDVKPSNLFAAPGTGIRLGDFGIAVARARSASAGDVSGTIKFMAPEQLRGEPSSRGTDAYGAGALACDLRYGTGPFAGGARGARRPHRAPLPAAAEPCRGLLPARAARRWSRSRARHDPRICSYRRHTSRPSSPRYDRSDRTAASLSLGKNRCRYHDCEITLTTGDLADQEAEGIVSSARFEMTMQTGASDALRRRGGDEIEREATAGGERALGECVATGAGRLHAKHVLHAVSAWNEASCVGRATLRALSMADRLGLRSLALPALGTGAARVSLETCANAMMNSLHWRLALGGSRLQRITIVLADEAQARRVPGRGDRGAAGGRRASATDRSRAAGGAGTGERGGRYVSRIQRARRNDSPRLGHDDERAREDERTADRRAEPEALAEQRPPRGRWRRAARGASASTRAPPACGAAPTRTRARRARRARWTPRARKRDRAQHRRVAHASRGTNAASSGVATTPCQNMASLVENARATNLLTMTFDA